VASLAGRITSLRAVLGREVSFAEVAVALQAGFEQALGVCFDLSPGPSPMQGGGGIIDEEWEDAARLRQTKYTRPAWNTRHWPESLGRATR